MTRPPPAASPRPAPAIRTAGGVLAAAFALHALTASAPYGLPALLPAIRRELGAGYFEAAVVSSAFLLGIVIGSPLAGSAVDAFGVRRSVLRGTLVATVALALVPVTTQLWLACLLLVTAGVGYAVITPGTNKTMLAWFSRSRRATAVGVKQTGVSAGGIAVASFVPAMSLAWGWQASFYAIALLYAGALLLGWSSQLDGPDGHPERGGRPHLVAALRALVAHRATVLLAVDGFLRVGIQYAFLTYLVVYTVDRLHAPIGWAAGIYAAAHLFGAVGRIGWGWTSDHVFGGRRRGPYAAIALTAAIGFLLLAFAAPLHTAALLASVALLGASAAGFQGVGLSLLAETGGDRAGAASGIVNALSFLGATLIVPACGGLLDAGASFALLFVLLAILCGLTAAIALAVPAPRDAEAAVG